MTCYFPALAVALRPEVTQVKSIARGSNKMPAAGPPGGGLSHIRGCRSFARICFGPAARHFLKRLDMALSLT